MKGAWIALIAALFILAGSPSQARRISTRSGPPPEGVSIPSLTHGQMTVIRDNLPAIKALANARLVFDLTTWREDRIVWKKARSTNALTPILPPDERSSCSSARSPAPITNRLMR